MFMMFVSYKMFFFWKWNSLGVDCVYSQNWGRVFEFIKIYILQVLSCN
jgi:hypothetical protein